LTIGYGENGREREKKKIECNLHLIIDYLFVKKNYRLIIKIDPVMYAKSEKWQCKIK